MAVNWTKEQKQVIDSRGGNLLVAAAAGSGKTAVLVERIIEMVMGIDSDGNHILDGIDIDELLVVTFTRAAADQMKEKIGTALSRLAEDMPYDEHLVKQLSLINRADITTIDSFCLGVVKDNFNIVGIDSSFDIADNAEMELMKSDVMERVLEEKYGEGSDEFTELVDAFSQKESDGNIVELVKNVYRVASGYPKPEIWMENAKKALEIETAEELYETGWFKAYISNMDKVLQSALKMIDECIDICNASGGPDIYLPAVLNDKQMIKRLIDADVDGRCSITISYDKLSSKKAEYIEIELRESVKQKRTLYKKLVDKALEDIRPVDEILAEIKMISRPMKTLLDLTQEYLEALKSEKREKNRFEFRDISEFAYDILCAGYDEKGHALPSGIGMQIAGKYKEILIDEYQDSNFLQEDILNCVAGHGEGLRNCFMVGDIKQSIYGFRMARPDLFLKKYHTYTEGPSDNRKLLLSKNFRSSKTVIDTVNNIFRPLMTADLGGIAYDSAAELVQGKLSKETLCKTEPCEVMVIESKLQEQEDIDKDQLEAVFIAKKILEITDKEHPMMIPDDVKGARPVSFRDIVILQRSTKKCARTYDSVFEEYGIPLLIESESGYFEATEVSILMSMLTVIDNCYRDYELAAVLRSPVAGLDESDLALIVGKYNQYVKSCGTERINTDGDYADVSDEVREYQADTLDEMRKRQAGAYLYDKIIYYVNQPDVPEIKGLREFLDMLDFLKQNKQYMRISEMIYYILDKTGYYGFAGAMKMGRRRQANIDMLISRADAYEDGSYSGLFNFLRYMEKLKVNEIDFSEAVTIGEDEDIVRVMTMHKSKGLEFPVVFAAGLGNTFIHRDTQVPVTVHADYYIASAAVDAKRRIKKDTLARKAMLQVIERDRSAEEMRLLYVTLTRAKEKLYMTACVPDLSGFEKKVNDIVFSDGSIEYNYRINAKTYIEWILMSLNGRADRPDIVKKQYLCAEDVLREEMKKQAENLVSREADARQTENMVYAGGGITEGAKWIGKPDLNNDGSMDKDTQSEKNSVAALYKTYKELLTWKYPHEAGITHKSKMSVSEIKRLKNQGEELPAQQLINLVEEDEEIPQLTHGSLSRKVTGSLIGTAVHKVMELLDFNMTSREEIVRFIENCVKNGFIDEDCQAYIHSNSIAAFLNSSLGQRMKKAAAEDRLYREQQFYIAMNVGDIHDDTIIVQGIIDAYFIEDGEIVLVDYKTDRVMNMNELTEKYHVQLEKYAEALEQLTTLKVKEKIIYSFCLNQEIEVLK